MIFRSVFEPLVLVQSNGAFEPFLASSIRTQRRRITIKLRPGIKFHDGHPLTSADVKYTLEAISKRSRSSKDLLRSEMNDLARVYAPNPQTVILVLKRVNHIFPAVLAEVAILPAHLYRKQGLRNPQLNRIPIGTGPFRVERRDGNRSLTLRRNDNYWGQPARSYGIRFQVVPDPGQALASMRNRELEIIPDLHPGYYPDQIETPRMKHRFQVFRIHPYRMQVMIFNLRRRVLQERRVRLALAHLVDRQRILQRARNNLGQVLSAPIWPLSPGYDKVLHSLAYDRHRAASLLDSAGWRDPKSKGRRRRLGWPLKLTILRTRGSPQMALAARIIRTEMRAVGIDAQIKTADFGFIKAQLRQGKFDIVLMGLGLQPGADLSPFFHSKGAFNVGRYSNPIVDRGLDLMRTISSVGNRYRVLRRLHRVLHEDPAMIVLYAPIQLMLVSRSVRGLVQNGRPPQLATLSLSSEGE